MFGHSVSSGRTSRGEVTPPPAPVRTVERSRFVHAILLSVHVSSHPQRQKLGSASERARVGDASGVGASTLTGTNGRLVDMERAQSSWHLRRVSPPVNSLEAFDLDLFICANAGGHGIAASTPEVVQLWYGNQKGDGGAHHALKLDNNFCLVITLRNKEAKVSERRCWSLCSVAFLLDLAVGV